MNSLANVRDDKQEWNKLQNIYIIQLIPGLFYNINFPFLQENIYFFVKICY